MSDFCMPSLGADMDAGTLVEWKVKPGDHVERGQIIAVVETQKGAIDVEIFESGTVSDLVVHPGEKVPVGSVLAHLDGAGTPAQHAAPEAPKPTEPEAAPPPPPAPPSGEAAKQRISPAARAHARELGVDPTLLHGSGPGGAITRDDVDRAAHEHARPKPTGMRQAIAAAMSHSKREIPHYYLDARIDLTVALRWLEQHNAPLAASDRVLPVVLLLKATALAARKAPDMNGYFKNGAFEPSPAVHLGVAISLREGGLVAPALRNVDEKPLDTVMRELADLIRRTRAGQLRSSELSDATLTVTSLGERGVDAVYGIIFPPQVALVGFGKVYEEPALRDGQLVARPMVRATLAADHRVSDGHQGGRFLSEIDHLLQTPEAL